MGIARAPRGTTSTTSSLQLHTRPTGACVRACGRGSVSILIDVRGAGTRCRPAATAPPAPAAVRPGPRVRDGTPRRWCLSGRFHPQYIFRDKNRCDIGKSQPKSTAKDGNAWRTPPPHAVQQVPAAEVPDHQQAHSAERQQPPQRIELELHLGRCQHQRGAHASAAAASVRCHGVPAAAPARCPPPRLIQMVARGVFVS
jgi:hypothetical protein